MPVSALHNIWYHVHVLHAADVMAAFKAYQTARGAGSSVQPPGVDVHVSVLTSGFWPTNPVVEVKLPQELETWQQVFLDFYTKKYSGRRLQWVHTLGSCVLRAAFPKGTKELSVSLFQAVVLCLFNDAPSLSFMVGAGCSIDWDIDI